MLASPKRALRSSRPTQTAARLPYFSEAWHKVTKNNHILNIVLNGYKIQFISIPLQYSYNHRNMSKATTNICKVKVSEFLHSKIIKVVSPHHDQYISHIFPVAKKTLGEYRIIFDLSELNTFVRKIKFRMDSLEDIINLIRPGDWFVSIDLSDAYYCIAIHILSMPFLTFVFLGVYYQFTCLPQGLSSAPRIFTKVMRVVLSFLRKREVRIAAWIDDFLLAAPSRAVCQEHAFFTVRTFEELGFLPNIGKSHLVPTQRLCHLGLVWDSVAYTVSVPPDKISTVKHKSSVALSSRVTVRFLSSILGSIEYFRWGFPYAALHYRRLQRFVNACRARGLSYDSSVSVSSEAKLDLTWWSQVGDTLPARPLGPFVASLELFCDASMTGWGCWTSKGHETLGTWSAEEAGLHINVLEFTCVLFGFRCFFRSSFNCSILIHTDSSTVVAYINNQGGTASRHLCDLSLELWDFCISRSLRISAVHIAGVENARADRLSRVADTDHSYSLDPVFFDDLCAALPFELVVDCFASRLNHKLCRFFSRYRDPLSSGVNAFSVRWVNGVYLFPPYPLIHRVITKFISDNTGHGVLIAPFWPSQCWYPSLLKLLISTPLLIPTDSVLDQKCRLPRGCRLVAYIIGSSPQKHMAFLKGLPFTGSGVLSERPLSRTRGVGESLVCGIVNGRVITVESL